MKKLLHYAFFLTLALGVACEGPEGPPGPEGEPGPPGTPGATGPAGEDAQTSKVFDIPDVTFTAENGFGISLNFAQNEIEVKNTDVIMVYLLWSVTAEGEPFFAPLPQSFLHENGFVKYAFLYSPENLVLTIDTDFETAAGPEWTDNQYFRIAIIPGEALTNARLKTVQPRDLSTLPYEEVIDMYGINDKNVPSYKQK